MSYTKEYIAEKLASNDTWLLRAVVAIYEYQTDSEQAAGVTREDNGVGFNGVDSEILSSFAKQIIRWEAAVNNRRFNTPLSVKQLAIARTKMKKYAGQLARIANAKEAATIAVAAVTVGETVVYVPSDEELEYNAAHK